ncbi:MAG: hypothetical protein G3M70_09535 [Candidatus Nitronauta litoralis]|uniref:Glycosyltransferase RgtA/B/C/D-like domain-containing protein n=1 Tax=Candidatus Nitronauta litoralis TaxID=2705533 RepID=A0A7T0BWF7_9BACT|nr:MAG: hypothetical protein G3M70_09535 [Candidatus Nitronauta litoralis]
MPPTSYTRFLIRLLILVYGVHAFSYNFADVDLWGHLKFGQEHYQTGSLAATDPFSYTAPGHSWINHEWLSELIFYVMFALMGSTGLMVLKIGVGLFIIHILSQWYFRNFTSLLAYGLTFFLLINVLEIGYGTRPYLFTYAFTAALVVLIYNHFEIQKTSVFWIPPMIILWINCHGGAVAGIAILGMVVVVESLRCKLKGLQLPSYLIISLVASGIALLINPYGHELLMFLVQTIPKPRMISEWRPVELLGSNTGLLAFKVMAVFSIITLFLKKEKRPWEIALVVCAVFFGFRHLRHTFIAGILLTPVFATGLNILVDKLKQSGSVFLKVKPVYVATILVALIVWQGSTVIFKLGPTRFQMMVDAKQFPVYAVRFMKENNLGGNVLVAFNWGEYLIWKLPNSKVSIDGRYWTVYPDNVILQNFIFHRGMKYWDQMLSMYPHDIILTHYLNKDLENRKDWVKIYQDGTARIFIPVTNPPSPALQKFQKRELVYNESAPSFYFP